MPRDAIITARLAIIIATEHLPHRLALNLFWVAAGGGRFQTALPPEQRVLHLFALVIRVMVDTLIATAMGWAVNENSARLMELPH